MLGNARAASLSSGARTALGRRGIEQLKDFLSAELGSSARPQWRSCHHALARPHTLSGSRSEDTARKSHILSLGLGSTSWL
jgi:hypothetical protein